MLGVQGLGPFEALGLGLKVKSLRLRVEDLPLTVEGCLGFRLCLGLFVIFLDVLGSGCFFGFSVHGSALNRNTRRTKPSKVGFARCR